MDPEAKEYEYDRLNDERNKLREALLWCSGSRDFQPGGIARDGWLKLCKPLIDAIETP